MRDAIIRFCLTAYQVLLPISWVALAAVVVILLPLAAFKRTRGAAGIGMFVASFVFGLTAWLLGAAVTFASFGWFGLIIGLVFAGLGVVPLGILGAFWKLDSGSLAASIFVLALVALVARGVGMKFMARSA